MFAEVQPDANSFLQFWLVLGLVGSVLGNIITPTIILVINFRRQRREISFVAEPVSKEEFNTLAKNNTERHGQLFKAIERVEREARVELERRFTDLSAERARTMDKLREEFTFIRENLSAINREMQIRNEERP